MITAQLVAISDLPVPEGSYVYQILPVRSTLAAISSNDSLCLIDPVTLQVFPNSALSNIHAGVTCMRTPKRSSEIIITTGRDGTVKQWDLRTNAQTISFQPETNAACLSLACNELLVAAGTELTKHQVCVSIWDLRNPAGPLCRYVESHNDDVTELAFHPSYSHILLSGSTDSLINIYDTNQTDEDEALISITNHGSSIHHAGFLSRDTFFGLSHDETCSLYQFDPAQQTNEEAKESDDLAFGDLRKTLGCEYIIDVLNGDDETGIVVAGSHSQQKLELVPMTISPRASAKFDKENMIRIESAHGEEIIRSVCFGDDVMGTVFTAGEDGCVKAWRTGPQAVEIESEPGAQRTKKKSNREDHQDEDDDNDDDDSKSAEGQGRKPISSRSARFKPY